jgi:mycobactin peptide synthetase MbtE
MSNDTHHLVEQSGRHSGDTETLIIKVLKDLLTLTHVDLNEHLVDIGGDSLVGIALMARVSEAYEIGFSPIMPFESESLRQLAARIDRIRFSQTGSS